MPDVKQFLSTVRGVCGAFLMKDNQIVESTFEMDADFLTSNLSLITDALSRKHGAVQKIVLSGNRNLFLFYHEGIVLGIEGDPTVPLPLLNIQVKIFFREIDEGK